METVRTQDEGAVRLVELDRPDALNAFSSQLMDDLCDVFLDAAADDSVKVLLLTGRGRAFSAGADLKEMGRPPKSPKHGFTALLDAIIDFPKPFLLAINGMGTGIGATICGLADFVLMAEDARLRCPFSTLGLTAEAGSTVTFPRLMGRQQAAWFLMSSEWMSAEACLEAGLAMAVYPAANLMPQSLAKAQQLAALPLSSLVMTKSLIMEPLRDELKAACARENKGLAELLGGDANQEALAAFIEKREPDFSGL